jgi:site-specific recombinase XerD
MTGIYIRVKRDGKWQSLEIEQLSQEELVEVFKDADKERVILFFAAVTKWMREHLIEDGSADNGETRA